MTEFSDEELLAQLGAALYTEPATPDSATLSRLHETLDLLASERVAAPPVRERSRKHGFSHRVSGRASILLGAVSALTLVGAVAAAAVISNTLPGPLRNAAYDIGLPVTSPPLYRADQTLSQLSQSIRHHELKAEKRIGEKLIKDVTQLNSGDLAKIHSAATNALSKVGLSLPQIITPGSTRPSTTSTVPSVTTPSVTVPSITVPGVTVPDVTVPGTGVLGKSSKKNSKSPATTLPTTTAPEVTTPGITLPGVTITP